VSRRKGTLNKPPRPLLNAVQSLKLRHILKDSEVNYYLATISALIDKFGYQGQEYDKLFKTNYNTLMERRASHAAGLAW
jgi:hypothetical protein